MPFIEFAARVVNKYSQGVSKHLLGTIPNFYLTPGQSFPCRIDVTFAPVIGLN